MSTVDVAAIRQRVAAGAARLDLDRPGWWQRINLDTLDLGDPCRCILGQEFGHYSKAPYFMDDEAFEVTLGFEAADDVVEPWLSGEYDALTAEWKRVIQARRAQAGA